MEILLVVMISAVVSGLTVFSGFGLGTVLLPVFALFFPIEVAIGMTALVHLLNNGFKFALLGKQADKAVVIKFGLPAIIAAFAGAWILFKMTTIPAIFSYRIGGKQCLIEPVKLVIGILMMLFAALELSPQQNKSSTTQTPLLLGGLLSGFFGGLSGHQGAFRSMFLLRAGLSKESFIATGVVIACLVDLSRLAVYGSGFDVSAQLEHWPMLLGAVAGAFSGVLFSKRFLDKMTMRNIQVIIAIMLFSVAIGLTLGLI